MNSEAWRAIASDRHAYGEVQVRCRNCQFREIMVLPRTWALSHPIRLLFDWCAYCVGDASVQSPFTFNASLAITADGPIHCNREGSVGVTL